MQTLVPLSWSSFCFFRDIYSFFLFCFVLFLWVWICQEKRFMYIVTSNNTWYSKWYRLIFWAWNRHCILRNLPLFFFLCFYVKSSRFQCCYVSVKKKKETASGFCMHLHSRYFFLHHTVFFQRWCYAISDRVETCLFFVCFHLFKNIINCSSKSAL